MRATILSLGVSACRQAGQWLDWGERALEDPISLDLVVGWDGLSLMVWGRRDGLKVSELVFFGVVVGRVVGAFWVRCQFGAVCICDDAHIAGP